MCELLGLDPLQVANEGTMVVAVAAGAGEATVAQSKLPRAKRPAWDASAPRAWRRLSFAAGWAARYRWMNRSEPPCRGFARAAYGLDLSDRSNVYHFPECFMSIRNLDALFKPRSIAVVGASNQPHTVGYALWQNVSSDDYQGAVFPVNLKYDTVQGVRIEAWPTCRRPSTWRSLLFRPPRSRP